MLQLLLIFLPIIIALYAYLLGRHRRLVLWAAGLALLLEGYIGSFISLDQSVRLLGAVFSLDRLGQLFVYTFLFLAAAIIIGAHTLYQGEFPVPIVLFVLGVTCAIVLLDDPIVISLLLEVVGLAIVLSTVDLPNEPVGLLPIPALMAGLKYLTMMVLSGITLVLGFLILSAFQDAPEQATYVKLAFGLLVVGFGLGTAVVPFHLWFPDLAGQTSTAVTSTLVSLVQGAALLLLGREFMRTPQLILGNPEGALWLSGGAVVAALLAALLATGQDRLKRLAAYASSYDVALILFAFSLADPQALQSGFLLIIHHGLALVLLLTCVGTLEWSTGRDDVAGLVGVAYRMPLVTLGLVVATLSLAGIPPFLGFAARWTLYGEAFSRNWLYAAGLFVAAAFFLLSMVRALWPALLPTEQTVSYRLVPWAVHAVIGVLIVTLLVLGLYPQPILEVLQGATGALGGG
jgi:multicomponent Na+:H+ antiporter subunit D